MTGSGVGVGAGGFGVGAGVGVAAGGGVGAVFTVTVTAVVSGSVSGRFGAGVGSTTFGGSMGLSPCVPVSSALGMGARALSPSVWGKVV